MNRQLLFFINPISGKGKNAGLKTIIGQKMAGNNLAYQILDTDKHGNYSYLPEKILTEKITDVVICGGDGSINQVVSHLTETNVRIGIIPLGSGNGLALAAGIPRNASAALDLIIRGNALPTDSISINDTFSCMLCGLGFDAQVAHDFAKQNTRGLMTYIKQTIRNFFRANTYPFEIHINNKRISTDAFFISIANSNQFGNKVTIAPKASLSDGLLDIVIVKKTNKAYLVYALLKQIRMGKVHDIHSGPGDDKTVLYLQTDTLTIQNPSMAPLHIDGEAVDSASAFNIHVMKHAFRLIRP